ncbi:MAG TPA: adenylate/guanylate cyclase domain-containing protein [Burkholderiaceae bacterium]|nr:adenylate/guanylate cyclase domain-containing protein [Burkholderiaceae bacterium]
MQGSRGRISLPLSEGLGALVPFSGRNRAAAAVGHSGSGNFRMVSAARVLSGDVDWKIFDGKVVLIGTSAPGLTDLRATPISETAPGVEIHATLIDAALRDAGAASGSAPSSAIRQRSQDARLSALAVVALIGVALSFGMPVLGAAGVLLLGGVGAAALVAWDMFAFWSLGWVMPMAAGLVLVAVLTALNLALGYLIEGRARRAVADLFGEYVSPALVERMTRDPMRFRTMTSENRELTIMFADIRGFTRIAESMEPGDLREFINEFLTVMTEVIHRHHGTVDKYIGDAVMAFWGAPVEDPAHADQAVSAALAMAAEVQRLNVNFARRGWPTLAMGVGLNTGVARVGDMGSRLRRAYTVLGDAVNLASRIEALTKQFNTPIIVGESTARHARSHRFTELAQVNVAGRSEAVRVFVPAVMSDSRLPIEQRPDTRVKPTRDRHDEVSRSGV